MKHNILLFELTNQQHETLVKAFAQNGYKVRSCKQVNDIIGYLARDPASFLIINVNLPHPRLLKQIKEILDKHAVPSVMFAKSSDKTLTIEAIGSGINVLIIDGFAAHRLQHILESAKAHFDETQRLKSEIRKLKIQLLERKAIDKAKGILMKRRAIDEDTAFGLIRKMAMDRNQNMAQVAANIIDVDGLLV